VTLSEPAKTTSNQVTFSYQACYADSVPGPVLATANLFPAGERAGISLQASNLVVQNVTVQDISVPFYEGWAGITFNNQGVNGMKVGSGNVIDHCTVKDMFGIYSAYISAISDNVYTGDNGTTEQVTITNNVIEGNGYYTGIEFAGNSSSTVQKNQVSNVTTGFFCDTGYNTGITISNNSFSGTNGIHLGPGAPQYFNNTNIQNNTITLTGSYGVGIGLCFNDSNVAITGNTITLQTAANGSYGINLATGSGTTGNTATSNTIVSTVQNIGINTSQNTILTLSQIKQKNSSSKSYSVPGGPAAQTAPGGGAATASSTTSSTSAGSAADQAQALAMQIDAQTTQMAQASANTDSSSAEAAQQQVVQQMSALARQLAVPGGSSKN
jgi:hypothetical protein